MEVEAGDETCKQLSWGGSVGASVQGVALRMEIDEWVMMTDYWWLIVDCLHTENADDTDVRRRTGEGELFLINDEGLMMTEDLMDYILSGYKLYENKGETWKYGQVLTKNQNIIVSLQRICDESG